MFQSVRRNKRDMLADLNCEPTSSRMIGHSTLEYMRPDGIKVIRFHETDIVLIEPDGTVQLFTGGWLTPTTKKRLNEYLPSGFNIYSDKGVWWVSNGRPWNNDNRQVWAFTEGMRVTPDGNVLGVDESKPERIKQLRKKITKFCNEMKKLDTMPQPDLGDCLICRLPVEQQDCLESHLDEVYIHGTLVLNAMQAYGCTPFVISAAFDPEHTKSTSLGSIGHEQAIRAVRRYLTRNLGLSI